MNDTPDQDALSTAKGLTGALTVMSGELKRLSAYGRTNRHLIWLTAASIALDILLTVLLVFAYGTAHDARVISEAQHSNLLASCALSNQSRAASVTLWDHVLSVSKPAPGSTAAQKAAGARKIAAFRAYVHKIYQPRDCQRLYKLP